MPALPAAAHRDRCYDCFRPRADCFCAAIPTIENQTEVLILQHMRERFHPFNTARIVHRALTNSRLLVDHTAALALGLPLKPGAGLLYPGPGATLLSDLPAGLRPEQLVVLDGTWHHAKTLVRDIPALHKLPRYRLAPAFPSRYRIRREPSPISLSTVEATVAALRALEPETRGLDQLLAAFDHMVERQLRHPKSVCGWRRKEHRIRTVSNIPLALLGDLANLVVAYGESSSSLSFPAERRREPLPRQPIYWVAQRLGTGERFSCAIRPEAPLPEAVLGHLGLTPEDFSQAMSLAEARESWSSFERPHDILAVYNPSTTDLLRQIRGRQAPCLVLKSVDLQPQRPCGTLDEIIAAEGLVPGPVQHRGRAGRRLANAIAFVHHLRAVANAPRLLGRL